MQVVSVRLLNSLLELFEERGVMRAELLTAAELAGDWGGRDDSSVPWPRILEVLSSGMAQVAAGSRQVADDSALSEMLFELYEEATPEVAEHDPFFAVGGRLVEAQDIREIVEQVLRQVLVRFGCVGGRLIVAGSGKRARRWGMGQRDGGADEVYTLELRPSGTAELRLWGCPWAADRAEDSSLKRTGSSAPALVAKFLPWIALALERALTQEALRDQATEHDEEVSSLEEELERAGHYRVLVEDAVHGIAIVNARTFRIVEANRALRALLGYRRDEILELRHTDVMCRPEDFDPAEYRQDLRRGEVVRAVHACITRTGEVLDLEITARLAFKGIVHVVARDVTEWRQAQQQLVESEERYALAVRGANDGLWDWNLRTGNVYYSARWKQMLGYEDGELGDSPDEWFGRVLHEDLPALRDALRGSIEGVEAGFEVEHRVEHRDGSYRWMLARGTVVRDSEGVAYRMAGSQTDFTERKKSEQALFYGAFHDSLTGLKNRAHFLNEVDRLLEEPVRLGNRFAILYVDLDRFKVINDSLGHAFGDRLLGSIAERLREAAGPTDEVARLGGDEFTILTGDLIDSDRVARLAEQVIRAVRLPFVLDGRTLHLSCSIGIAFSYLREYESAEEMLRDADMAMYLAKEKGKARFEIFSERLHLSAVRKLQLETDLRGAIAGGELELYYQPLVSVTSKELVAFEALARWKHPTRGMVSPGDFIPMAEESGMIHELGAWAVSAAAEQWRTWHGRPDVPDEFSISVNVSPQQFRRADIVDEIISRAAAHDLPDGALTLEITESSLIEDSDQSIRKIERLRREGFRVVIDDFGVGYSSFSYLVRLPVNAIKIDRSFVDGMEGDEAKQKVVSAIVNLAESLGVDIVAEGVETRAQCEILEDLSTRMRLQGAYFSMPVAVAEAERFFGHYRGRAL